MGTATVTADPPAAPVRPPTPVLDSVGVDGSPASCESRYRPAASPGAAQTPVVRGGVGLSTEQIRALPAAFTFDPVVPAAFGISRSAAYRALAAGQLPIRPFRVGRRLIVARADLMAALGIEDTTPPQATGGDDGQLRDAASAPDPVRERGTEGDR